MSLITPYLYIGGIQEAQDITFLQGSKVHTIVNCAREIPDFFPNNFQYIRLDLDDVPHQSLTHVLDPISRHIIQMMRAGKVVFVHCAAGISRSASVVIYTLMKLHRWNFDKAFRFVRELHPRADPNQGFIQQLASQNNPIQREGIPMYVGDSGHTSNVELLEDPDTQTSVQSFTHDAQSEAVYEAPRNIYQRPGGMTPIQDPSQPGRTRGWRQLTFDCPECDLPEYSPGGGRGLYARIFS